MKIGYARVSTAQQNIEMQIDALKKEGCETIYQEKRSAFAERPELDNAIKCLRPGDTLVVWSFDRLGRKMLEVMSNVKIIQDKGATVYSIIQRIDTNSPVGQMMLFNFSMFAEMETTLRRERQQAGLAIARAVGRPHGRKKGMTDRLKNLSSAVSEFYMKNPDVPVPKIAAHFGIAQRSVYKCLTETGAQKRGSIIINERE
jgi:DNA invertase Pin-like site-specific DNA recombinase